MTLNDLERRNGPFALFHRIHVQCRLKTLLLGLHPFQNLVLIVYDHINYDLRDYSASIWAKQQEATASSSDCSCLRPCLLSDEFLVSLAMGASICGAKRVGRASPFLKVGLMGR